MKKTYKIHPKKMTVCDEKKSVYDRDFYKWTKLQADHLKKKDFSKIDFENLIEEIESLGRSEKKELKSKLVLLLTHLLKIKYQPSFHSRSWDLTVTINREDIQEHLIENPSLKSLLNDIIISAYRSARLEAAKETGLDVKIFPKSCPWTKEEILGY